MRLALYRLNAISINNPAIPDPPTGIPEVVQAWYTAWRASLEQVYISPARGTPRAALATPSAALTRSLGGKAPYPGT